MECQQAVMEKTQGFFIGLGCGKETELVAGKGQSALYWEKLLEETPWAVACDLKQGL